MKKIILATMLLIGCLSQTYAQMGIRGGLNLSGMSNQEDKIKTGGIVGIFYQSSIGDRWRIEPGLQWTVRRQEYQYTDQHPWGLVGQYEFSMKFHEYKALHSIDIPLRFKFLLSPKLHLSAAPFLSFILPHEMSMYTETCLDGDCVSTRYDDEYGRYTELGFSLGAGYQLTNKMGVELFYQDMIEWFIVPYPASEGHLQLSLTYQLITSNQ